VFVHKLRRSPSGPSPDCLSFFLSVGFKGLYSIFLLDFLAVAPGHKRRLSPFENLPTLAHLLLIQLPTLRRSIFNAQLIVVKLSFSSFFFTLHSSSTRFNRSHIDLSTVSSLPYSLLELFEDPCLFATSCHYNIGTHTPSLHDDGH
jgi:hypothetical protein